ncbi:MAG: hypothetical protein ACUVX8_18140 [Candidatus Zipacnadales bacterium]
MPLHKTVVIGTALPPNILAHHPEFESPDLILRFDGSRPNVLLNASVLSASLGCPIPPQLKDLLEIAVAVYAADIAFPRGQNDDWVRSCAFLIPVRDPAFWCNMESALAETLYVLSHDVFVFEFCARTEPKVGLASPHRCSPFFIADCVSLLSGGIDSFAGATLLLATERSPLFMAHRPHNPAVIASQEHVVECLRRNFGPSVCFLPVPCGPSWAAYSDEPFPPPEMREVSQRTRAFLYLALGAIACHAIGSEELFCPENGLLALNPPLTEARVGGYSTAGTRPRTLAYFEKLFAALGTPIHLLNPFLYQTKGQLIRDILRPHFSTAAIQHTVSCWMVGRMSRPCGSCIPCLVRAISMHAAGLPAEAYFVDPLHLGRNTRPNSAARANLVDLLVFVHRLRTMNEIELLHAYPVLLDLPPGISLHGLIAMLRRFANEASAALGNGFSTAVT